MRPFTLEFVTDQINLSDQLWTGRDTMLEPQDLPGRFGRVVKAIDRVLQAAGGTAVLAGGWAVWRHGYSARLTQDVDIVVPKDQIDEFLRVASVSGFEVLPAAPGRWRKVRHKETGIQVDLMPEGGRPGTAAHPAPTTIAHPSELGAVGSTLHYITLPSLIELKVAAGRGRDDGDIIELMRANAERAGEIRDHLARVHADYAQKFDMLAQRAREQQDH